jgi:ABC-type lipoprotein export system ATPase subunit
VSAVPDLTVRDLVVRAPSGRSILHAARLDLPAGGTLVVRGPSGAGKSTLLHALAGLVTPATGSIRWGECELAGLPATQRDAFRLATIGLIFQEFLLFEELSAHGNAAIAAAYVPKTQRAALSARAAELLKRLGVPTAKRDVASFSGGERQRVAIARALASDPAVILAAEPTASLDRPNADRLVGDLLALVGEKGITVIVVSHDPAVTGAMDRVIDVVDGEVQA